MSMMGGDIPNQEELLLHPEDFPEGYVNFAHRDDYVVCQNPMQPNNMYHHRRGQHRKLLLRISWQLDGTSFSSMTFVLDTGAPRHLYLGSHTLSLLESRGLIHEDTDTGADCVVLFGSKCPVVETPPGHAPANVIGLPLLMRWCLHLDQDSFSFSPSFPFLCK